MKDAKIVWQVETNDDNVTKTDIVIENGLYIAVQVTKICRDYSQNCGFPTYETRSKTFNRLEEAIEWFKE